MTDKDKPKLKIYSDGTCDFYLWNTPVPLYFLRIDSEFAKKLCKNDVIRENESAVARCLEEWYSVCYPKPWWKYW